MSHKTILVVDDEEVQRRLIRGVLRPEYVVLEACDYDDALAVQRAHRGKIDLLLIDVTLPGGNGYDLAQELLAVEPYLRSLFVSGHAGAEVCKFFDMPVTDVHFLQKPFEPSELLRRVKSVMEMADPFAGYMSAD